MGVFSDRHEASYGKHSIVVKGKSGLMSVKFSLYIDDKLIDTSSKFLGTTTLIGLIQDNGVDKPVKVEITQSTGSYFKLFINHNQIPLKKIT